MATQAQITANRRNALRSTGPRTSQGMTIASQNALKYGFSAHQAVISSENQADFDLYRDQMLEELNPIGPMESMLAERVVTLSWRLNRASRIQNQTIDALSAKNTTSPLTKLIQSMSKQSEEPGVPADSPESTPNLPLGRLAIRDFTNARVLDRLLMYERRIENSLYKTILELQRLNLIKKL